LNSRLFSFVMHRFCWCNHVLMSTCACRCVCIMCLCPHVHVDVLMSTCACRCAYVHMCM
jgi:hypothetical protein